MLHWRIEDLLMGAVVFAELQEIVASADILGRLPLVLDKAEETLVGAELGGLAMVDSHIAVVIRI